MKMTRCWTPGQVQRKRAQGSWAISNLTAHCDNSPKVVALGVRIGIMPVKPGGPHGSLYIRRKRWILRSNQGSIGSQLARYRRALAFSQKDEFEPREWDRRHDGPPRHQVKGLPSDNFRKSVGHFGECLKASGQKRSADVTAPPKRRDTTMMSGGLQEAAMATKASRHRG